MRKYCEAYDMENASDAWKHMELYTVRSYGSHAYGHSLHTWDWGERLLCRCRNCGGYLLVQHSEFHSFTDAGDSYYSDYFFLDGPEEADGLNREFDGFQIENQYRKRYLCNTNGRIHWSR